MTDIDLIRTMLERGGIEYRDDRATGQIVVNGACLSFKTDGELDNILGEDDSWDE